MEELKKNLKLTPVNRPDIIKYMILSQKFPKQFPWLGEISAELGELDLALSELNEVMNKIDNQKTEIDELYKSISFLIPYRITNYVIRVYSTLDKISQLILTGYSRKKIYIEGSCKGKCRFELTDKNCNWGNISKYIVGKEKKNSFLNEIRTLIDKDQNISKLKELRNNYEHRRNSNRELLVQSASKDDRLKMELNRRKDGNMKLTKFTLSKERRKKILEEVNTIRNQTAEAREKLVLVYHKFKDYFMKVASDSSPNKNQK